MAAASGIGLGILFSFGFAKDRMIPATDGETELFVSQKIDERLPLFPADEVLTKEIGNFVISPRRLTAHVRCDDHLRKVPEPARRWQRLLLGNVHDRAGQMPGF